MHMSAARNRAARSTAAATRLAGEALGMASRDASAADAAARSATRSCRSGGGEGRRRLAAASTRSKPSRCKRRPASSSGSTGSSRPSGLRAASALPRPESGLTLTGRCGIVAVAVRTGRAQAQATRGPNAWRNSASSARHSSKSLLASRDSEPVLRGAAPLAASCSNRTPLLKPRSRRFMATSEADAASRPTERTSGSATACVLRLAAPRMAASSRNAPWPSFMYSLKPLASPVVVT
mmetsp:Transcript_11648/g.45317  ORF Transcript_11648/g.45317 Transcript_11648/m.45317 type:complete len:237 (+) Transcript_11648:3468-4178(+)